MQANRQIGKNEGRCFLWLWGPVIVYCAFIFTVSAQQDLSPPQFPSSDKVAHFLVYSVLGILWARAAQANWPHWKFSLLLLSTMFFTGLYGVTDEWHQFFVPGRFSDWRDTLADVCGGTIGGTGYLVGLRLLTRKTEASLTPVG